MATCFLRACTTFPSSTKPRSPILGIGRKFQKPTVFEMHTVADNLLLALRNDRRPRSTLRWSETADEISRIEKILETIRLTTERERLAGSLAHGQKQWLEIGMLLAQEPKLLLVDEPVAGMTDAETSRPRSCSRRSTATRPSSWSSTTWPSCANSASR